MWLACSERCCLCLPGTLGETCQQQELHHLCCHFQWRLLHYSLCFVLHPGLMVRAGVMLVCTLAFQGCLSRHSLVLRLFKWDFTVADVLKLEPCLLQGASCMFHNTIWQRSHPFTSSPAVHNNFSWHFMLQVGCVIMLCGFCRTRRIKSDGSLKYIQAALKVRYQSVPRLASFIAVAFAICGVVHAVYSFDNTSSPQNLETGVKLNKAYGLVSSSSPAVTMQSGPLLVV